MKVLKGGIIACGFFSRHHQDAWLRMPNVSIVAACVRSIERSRATGHRAYDLAEAMFESNFLTSLGTSQGLISKLNGGRYFKGDGSLDSREVLMVGLLFQEDFDSI